MKKSEYDFDQGVHPIHPELDRWVPCRMCSQQIRISTAVREADNGQMHYFCGLDCYHQWSAVPE